MKILELKQNIFKENEVTADKIREEFKKQKKLMINVMSSPGSGKTTTLLRTIERLQDITRIGVMECDIDASVDAVTIENGGAKAIQLHTGGMCHMDAAMTQQGLNEMGVDDVDLIFIENVGNLVCPAEFDTGAGINITILSVPEGDDKPAKYPLVYTVSDVVLINKVDALAVFDFDKESNRYATYNDFCIILDRGSKMSLFKKVFEYLDIPMEVYKDNNLIEENDIFIIKNIIGLILSIKDGIYNKNLKYYFTSVARSYIGNLCDNEIFKCFEENKIFKTDIYNKCYEISKDIDIMTPNILLKRIIKDFDFYDKFILVGNVDAAIKRINYLLELSKNAENLGFSIIDFSNYLNEMIDSDQEIKYKEAKSNSISVKIMNIHKSKGLEFPICYFAGFPKTFNISDLKNKFMFDNKYGILTPFYKEGIGETFVKTLAKNNYYLNEVAEKIRLFYVALTRAKEKMIMVMPNIEDKKYVKDEISFMDGIKFRSFYDFIKSISGNLAKYMISVDLNNVGVTKDYEFSKSLSKNMVNNEEANMLFIEDEIPFIEIEKKHASKTIKEILSVSDEKTLEFGTKIHELLELTDFKNANTDNKYVNHLLNTFDFNCAKIYQELEFSYELDDVLYHGIIDLMLEYEDKIFIIDYKLKNIDDENYIKQLNVYYNYVKCISNKDVHMYLYSILDNVTKEII